ncbi:MAG: hypothetical protein ABMA26_11005 [Limisphaerales bacterium]
MSDIWPDLMRKLEPYRFRPYLICTCVLLLVFGLPWLIAKRHELNCKKSALRGSLYLALILAPSLLPAHGGAMVLPAVVMVVLGLIAPILSFYSLLSVFITWGAIYVTWRMVILVRNRHRPSGPAKSNASNGDSKP